MSGFIFSIFKGRHLVPVIVLAFAGLISSATAAQAEWTSVESPDMAAPQQGVAPRKEGLRAQRLRAQQPQAEAEKPEPMPAAPPMERSGDDLIIHSAGGEYSMPGFFAGMQPGTVRAIPLQLPGQGACTAQIDINGAVVNMTCR